MNRFNVKHDLETVYHDLTDGEFYKSKNLFETDIRKKHLTTVFFQLLFPWVVLIGAILLIAVLHPLIFDIDIPKKVFILLGAYVIPPAGKESVIPTLIGLDIHPVTAALLITLLDTCFSLFIVWNLDLMYKFPVIGVLLHRTNAKGLAIMKTYPVIRRVAFGAIMVFVAFPLQGSGGIVASLVGKIVGMPPYKTVAAVALGSFIGSLAIAYLSTAILKILEATIGKEWAVAILGLIVAVLIIIGLARLVNFSFNRLTERPLKMLASIKSKVGP